MIHNPELKVAEDFFICSVCRHHPDIFTSLLSAVTATVFFSKLYSAVKTIDGNVWKSSSVTTGL